MRGHGHLVRYSVTQIPNPTAPILSANRTNPFVPMTHNAPRDYSAQRRALEDVWKVLDKQKQIDELEAEKEVLKENLVTSLTKALHDAPFSQVQKLGSDIYWMHPNFAELVKKTYKAATGKGLMPLSHPTHVPCTRCGDLITEESWTQYKALSSRHAQNPKGSFLCLKCVPIERGESREANAQFFADYQARVRAEQEARLKAFQRHQSMPYAEYVKTERWKLIEASSIEDAGYRCQICNGSEQLSAHLRSPEYQGREGEADVIVLCGECSSTRNLIQQVRNIP